jgi:hypothetical protein
MGNAHRRGEKMKQTLTLSLLACAGLASRAQAIVNSLMEFQVSAPLAENWGSSIDVLPGGSVDIRVRISYTGTASPIGLGSVVWQPTASNWDTLGANQDLMTPLINNGVGGDYTTPPGAVDDLPGQYGRVHPFARTANTSDRRLMGHVNINAGVTYLRIAQAQITNWISGNSSTSGGAGVDSSQNPPAFRPTYSLPFDTATQNIVIFKFNVTLSTDPAARVLIADAPYELFGNYDQATGERQVRWVANTNEVSGSIRGTASTIAATINVVPGPPGALGALVGILAVTRRRRGKQRHPALRRGVSRSGRA